MGCVARGHGGRCPPYKSATSRFLTDAPLECSLKGWRSSTSRDLAGHERELVIDRSQ